MRSLAKAKNYDSVLVVVDRAVGYCWLIPTTTKATAIATMELLQNYIFIPHGVPTSIVSDPDPEFTFRFWRQTLKTMGVEQSMAVPGHHQTNGQAEHKIRELKTALRTVIVTGALYREVNSKVATTPKLKVEDKDRVNNSRSIKSVKLNIVKLKASLNYFSRGKLVIEVECQTLKLK